MFNYLNLTSLLSSTLPKRTEAMRAHVLVFHAGQSEITTTIPLLTCGSIVHTAATCIMEGNWSAHFLPLPRVTPSPASWTWKLTPYHLLRMTRSDQIFTVNIQGFSLSFTDMFFRNLCVFVFFCQEPKLAFEGVVASELYPCVLFYSSNPGEKVLNILFILYCRHLTHRACCTLLPQLPVKALVRFCHPTFGY